MIEKSKIPRNPNTTKAHLIGGGIGSLAAACYMIRDAKVPGHNIHIYELLNINGGSMDGSGDAKKGYMIRGGRMFNIPTYECLQELMSTIPSIEFDNTSMHKEFIEFNEEFKTMARSRLVSADGTKPDVTKMGFDTEDRVKLMMLIIENEEKLGNKRIDQYFSPHFFTTNFWYMWQTTFAFQKWSSLAELRRYMIRLMREFPRIHTLAGVARSAFNQYDSIILPIVTYLKENGVNFHLNARVIDIRFSKQKGYHFVSEFDFIEDEKLQIITVDESDIVTFTNGCITDNSTEGTTGRAVEVDRSEAPSFGLWKRIAYNRPEFGKPEVFCGDINGSLWQSFTVTINNNPALFEYIQRFTNNHPGGGALVTFKDSGSLLSIVVARQPHFKKQPLNTQVFWGYFLNPDLPGDYVKKPMLECTGMEIVEELLYHLHALDRKEEFTKNLICRTCIMPYVDSLFMARNPGDRPLVNPEGYENFAFISQFAEQPEDIVFTVEYSVRCAQRAVYYLFGVDKEMTPINHYEREPKVLMDSFLKMHS